MTLRLRPAEDERIRAHLTRVYPDEGCGVLLGTDADGAREVRGIMAFENRREDSRHNRYLIAPEQFLTAERAARAAGLDVVGFFHSHPDHPPRPSAFDLEHAWPYYSYLIVSVERGEARAARCFRLADDRSRFEEEEVEMPPAAEGRSEETRESR
ncbi:MAG TPA: M67 family metallopeptidase [Candidatus Eisenbacteria bacterium]